MRLFFKVFHLLLFSVLLLRSEHAVCSVDSSEFTKAYLVAQQMVSFC